MARPLPSLYLLNDELKLVNYFYYTAITSLWTESFAVRNFGERQR